ncbi:unnamed protein product [Closterium sp. NIES-54]
MRRPACPPTHPLRARPAPASRPSARLTPTRSLAPRPPCVRPSSPRPPARPAPAPTAPDPRLSRARSLRTRLPARLTRMACQPAPCPPA